jgi:hypothetical protein
VVDDLYSLVVGTSAPETGVRRLHLLYVGAERLARSLELNEVLAALAADLPYTVALSARRKLFIKAGVVGWRGQALLILGPHNAGTTTLVAALVRAGATYYSSRYAPLDARGRVYPFPTPLGPSPHPDRPRAPRDPITSSSAERTVRLTPLPISAVILTNYAGGARWRPARLTPAQAVLALLEHSVAAAVRPSFALRVLDAAVRGTRAVLQGTRGEADDVSDRLLALTAGEEEVRCSTRFGKRGSSYARLAMS